MIETKTKEIDGKTWTVLLFPAGKGLGLLRRLMATLGPVLGAAADGAKGSGLDFDTDDLDLGSLFGVLAERLDDAKVETLIIDLLEMTSFVDPESGDAKSLSVKAHFDMVFAGEYLTMMKVVAYVAEVNFKLPFSSLRSLAVGPLAKA